jgi:hypothetical protein
MPGSTASCGSLKAHTFSLGSAAPSRTLAYAEQGRVWCGWSSGSRCNDGDGFRDCLLVDRGDADWYCCVVGCASPLVADVGVCAEVCSLSGSCRHRRGTPGSSSQPVLLDEQRRPAWGRFADLLKPSSHAVLIACRHAVIRADSDSARQTPARSITRPCAKVMIEHSHRPASTNRIKPAQPRIPLMHVPISHTPPLPPTVRTPAAVCLRVRELRPNRRLR